MGDNSRPNIMGQPAEAESDNVEGADVASGEQEMILRGNAGDDIPNPPNNIQLHQEVIPRGEQEGDIGGLQVVPEGQPREQGQRVGEGNGGEGANLAALDDHWMNQILVPLGNFDYFLRELLPNEDWANANNEAGVDEQEEGVGNDAANFLNHLEFFLYDFGPNEE